MFQRVMVPVDLQHLDVMQKALAMAADIASRHSAELWYVAVTGKVPNRVAKTPEEFAEDVEAFAAEQSRESGLQIQTRIVSSVDIIAELDDKLLETAQQIKADLIVMPSHVPGLSDRLHLIRSNAAYIVRHSTVSVFVVR